MRQVTEAEVIALASALAGSGGGGSGDGDMKKSVYDTDNNGIVDNAEKVNNHTVEKDVPSDAVFTDTVYDDTEIQGAISSLEGNMDDKQDADDKMTGADMEEILSVLPIARDNFQKYSTQEQVVGEWIDGKPVYQQTLDATVTTYSDATNKRTFSYDYGSEKVVINAFGYVTELNGSNACNGFLSVYVDAAMTAIATLSRLDVKGHTIYYDRNKSSGTTQVKFTVTIQYTKTTD